MLQFIFEMLQFISPFCERINTMVVSLQDVRTFSSLKPHCSCSCLWTDRRIADRRAVEGTRHNSECLSPLSSVSVLRLRAAKAKAKVDSLRST